MKIEYIFLPKSGTIEPPSKYLLKKTSLNVYRNLFEIMVDDELVTIPYDEYLDINNNLCYFWIEYKDGRINKNAKILTQVHKSIVVTPHRKIYHIIKIKDEVSDYFCNQLYPLINYFERSLRELVYLMVIKTYGAEWPSKTKLKVKGHAIENGLEHLTIGQLYHFLFGKHERTNDLWSDLSKSNLNYMSKNEIIQYLEEKKPISLWEQIFKSEIDISQELFEKITEWRNFIAHSNTIHYHEFKKYKSGLLQSIKENDHNIGKIKTKNFTSFEKFLIQIHWEMLDENYNYTSLNERTNASNNFEQSLIISKNFLKEKNESIFALLNELYMLLEPTFPTNIEALNKEEINKSIIKILKEIYEHLPDAFNIISPLIFDILPYLIKCIPGLSAEQNSKLSEFADKVSSVAEIINPYEDKELENRLKAIVEKISENDKDIKFTTMFTTSDFIIFLIKGFLLAFPHIIQLKMNTMKIESNRHTLLLNPEKRE